MKLMPYNLADSFTVIETEITHTFIIIMDNIHTCTLLIVRYLLVIMSD